MRALIKLKDTPHYRKDAFTKGFINCGYEIVDSINDINSNDVLLIWNRRGFDNTLAAMFEQKAARVIVAENGYLGHGWNGNLWYALSKNYHNGAGNTHNSKGERWNKYKFELLPYRDGKEIVLLPQRGIGSHGVAMPSGWTNKYKYRIRNHPGMNESISLEQDLKNCKAVITWASGAAIKAMALGIPVFYEFGQWIARDGATHISEANLESPQMPDRQKAFERIFDGMFNLSEIESGEAIQKVLS